MRNYTVLQHVDYYYRKNALYYRANTLMLLKCHVVFLEQIIKATDIDLSFVFDSFRLRKIYVIKCDIKTF